MIKLLGLHIHWTTYLKYVKLSHSSLQATGTGITTMNSSSETNFSELMTNSGCCLVRIMSHNHRILHMADLVSNVAKVSPDRWNIPAYKKGHKKIQPNDWISWFNRNRENRIWTCDPYVPNVVLYQAELLPEKIK